MEILGIVGISLIIILFACSALFNVYLIKRLLAFQESVDSLGGSIEFFVQHIEKVHAQELYYGDETIKLLLEHSSELREDVQDFLNVYQAKE